MKYILLLFVISLSINGLQAQEDKKAKAQAAKDFSYAYGYRFGQSLEERQEFSAAEKDYKIVAKGIKAGLKPDSSSLAKIGTYVDDRVAADTSYEGSPEKAKKMAYNLGYLSTGNIVYTFELPTSDFHYASLKKGFFDFNKKKTPKISKEKMEETLDSYFQKMQEKFAKKEQERKEQERKANAEKSEKFLAENGKKEGVKTTASGLQYLVLKEGAGASPSLTNKVKVHYHGMLIDGKVFDSSVDRGEPISFPLSNLIQGWQEGIPLMKVGSKYRFFIPSNLAYGDNAPPSIGPSQALIFEVELLDIIQEIPSNSKADLSYGYGYMIGMSLEKVSLTDKETNVQDVIAGMAKGFEASPKDMSNAEQLLSTRIQQNTPAISDEAAKGIAYSIGYTSSGAMSLQLGSKMEDFDLMEVGKGYEVAKAKQEPRLSMEQINEALRAYFEPKQKAMQQKQEKENEGAALVNIEAGKKFLAENGKKEGIITLPSGLQYQILKEGTGAKPTLTSTVSTHYHGTLINGTIFDSSVERGQPASFPVNGVIKGWTEALQLMPVGSKWRLFVPYNLAYGTRAMGPKIPAGSTLIFDVELLEIVK